MNGRHGANPFRLDSPRPTIPFKDYAYNEIRYRSLATTRPEDARELLAAAQHWVDAQLDGLWEGKALEVAAAIAALPSTSAIVRQAHGYFEAYHGRMDYPTYRAAGYPIGSGAVEGANRSVVQHRMKRPGPGWQRANAQSMLAALCELHSNRFETAWASTSAALSTNLR